MDISIIKKIKLLIREEKILTAKGILVKHDRSTTWITNQIKLRFWSQVFVGGYCLYADNDEIGDDLKLFLSLGEITKTATEILIENNKKGNRAWLLRKIADGELIEISVNDKVKIYVEQTFE